MKPLPHDFVQLDLEEVVSKDLHAVYRTMDFKLTQQKTAVLVEEVIDQLELPFEKP